MNEDSSDEEIFVVKHIKPVNSKITLQRAIEIKEKVLEKLKQEPSEEILVLSQETTTSCCVLSNETSDDVGIIQETAVLEIEKPKPPDDENKSDNNNKTLESTVTSLEKNGNPPVTPQRKRRRSRSSSNTPTKKISEYFTPTKKPSTESPARAEVTPPKAQVTPPKAQVTPPKVQVTPPKAVNGENSNVHLSPSLRKRSNRFYFNLENDQPSTSKSVKQRSPPKRADPVSSSKSESSALTCQLFQKIVHDEMEKQLKLEQAAAETKTFERLISEEECQIIERFFKLDLTCRQLFVRMYSRVHKWHRQGEIKYDDIQLCLSLEFNLLAGEKFFDANIDEMELQTQLDLFKVFELTALCRNFNIQTRVDARHSATMSKKKMIEAIINDNKNQKSVLDMLKKSKKNSRMDLLKREINKTLGPCFRLNEKVVRVFDKLVLLFSLVHNVDDHNKRVSDTIFTLMKEYYGNERWYKYELSPSVIFKTREDFLMYERAVKVQQELEDAVASKDFETFDKLAKATKLELEKILKDEEFIARFRQLPSFLKRFSAGTVYARMLTTFCEKFKMRTKKTDLISVASFLLDQNTFNVGKKGKWYEFLSMAYESSQRADLAAKILLLADKDDMVNEVQKLALQLRGQTILKRKTNGLKNEELREKLDEISTVHSVQEPPSIEIRGKAMEGAAGFKSVYEIESEHGKSYSSVEEQAIYHYKKYLGFSEGMHVEGAVIQTIFYLLFFDLIYQVSPPGVFQSAYQEAPLDLYSRLFYENRKEAIDIRLNDLSSWSEDELTRRINIVYYENFGVNSVISWNEDMKPELYVEIIKCIGMERLVKILRRIVENFRVVRSGFPDLTLWNPKTSQIKFVEVKSPNDKLSCGQRVWLNFLRTIGVDCEVCNVKNVGGKRIRS